MTETREQAATRRRWITLAEFVAVAGLLIGVATLYLNWSDRREDQVAKAQETVSATKARGIVTLTGEVKGDDSIALSDQAHTLSAVTVRFPATFKLPAQDAMPGPRLRVTWFASQLLAMTDKGADEREGRLPVLIAVTWWDGDTKREDVALYDILWRTEGRMFQGRKLILTGLALSDRTGSTAELEQAWAREKPRV